MVYKAFITTLHPHEKPWFVDSQKARLSEDASLLRPRPPCRADGFNFSSAQPGKGSTPSQPHV